MQSRPVIGIPTQTLQAIDRIPEDLPHSWVMNSRYYTAVTSVGAVPWMVPLLDEDPETLREIYNRLDGVFLAGGVDLDPASYGDDRHDLCGRTDLARDRVEILFARWAIEDGKPILGVCRGMQVINVAAGGALWQDCAAQMPESLKHDYFPGAGWARDHLAHEVRVVEDSRLYRALGAASAQVNSMHHQAIRTLGDGLTATAVATDGVVEALEGPGEVFLVGVQWHPEMLIDSHAGTRRLFEDFIEAAQEFHSAGALAGI
ncbi:MAG: gamma-glutamyl-gamma-aminobutyrate hydrolase family protein [Gemmatimonadota bacterium]|nr:gamma-glutamyl-gamma-aminobutyrate hydrolase family protein [Gemmatimonadota bacterium]